MEKRLAAENAEVGIPVRLRIADDPVELVERHLLRGRGHIHPAPLATELTARDDRNEQERRKVLAAPPPPFVELDRADALHAEVVDELRHDLRIGFGQHALGQGEQHAQAFESAPVFAASARRRAPRTPRRFGLGQDLFRRRQRREHFRRDVEVALERNQAGLALLERALVVAFLREARLRLHAAVAQHRIHVAAEQRRDVHLHRFPPDVVGLHLFAVDRSVAILREHDRHFGTDAGAGRTVGLAVALVLHLNLALGRDAVDVEEAEAQALHAVGAARVVDDREPRLPCGRGAACGCVRPAFDGGGQRRGIDALGIHDTHARCVVRDDAAEVSDHDGGAAGWIARRGCRVLPARDFEAPLEQQARQRGAIGRTHPAACTSAQHHMGSPGVRDAHTARLRKGASRRRRRRPAGRAARR